MTKRKKILIIIASIIVVLLAIVQFYANSVVKKFIENELNTFIEEQKENYHIEVGVVKVQLLLKRFSIEHVKLESLDSIPQEGNVSFNLSIDKIIVKLKNYSNVFSEGILTLKSIELDKPIIKLTRSTVQDTSFTTKEDKFESNQLNEVILALLKVDKGDVLIYEYNGKGANLVASSSDLDLLLTDIHFQQNKEELGEKITYSDLSLSTSDLKYLKLSKHNLSLKGVHYSNIENEIKIEDLYVQNRQDKAEFNSRYIKNESWEMLHAVNLLLKLDLNEIKKNKFFFKYIDIGKLDFDLIKYKGDQDSSKLELSDLLAKIKSPFSIDTLKIRDGNIDLSFQSERKEDHDDYSISGLAFNCFRLSNDSLYLDKNPALEANIKGRLWKEGIVDGNYTYHYEKKVSAAAIHFNELPKSIIKKLLLNNKFGFIRNASLNKVSFNYLSDSSHIEGNLKIDLSGLDLDYNQFPKDSKWSNLNVKLDKLHLNSSFSKDKDAVLDLFIDTLSLGGPDIVLTQKKDISNLNTAAKNNKKEILLIMNANYILVDKGSVTYQNEGEEFPLLHIESFTIKDKGLALDLRKEGKDILKSEGIFNIELKTTNLYKGSLNFLTLNNTLIDNNSNKIKITGLRFKNISSKDNFHKSANEGNIWNSAYIEEVNISSVLKNLLNSEFVCENVKIVRPILTHIEAIDRADVPIKVKEIKPIDFPISIKNMSIVDADIDFRVKTNEYKEFEVFDLTKMNANIKSLSYNPKNNDLSFNASMESEFYEKGRLHLDIQLDQKNKKSKTSIKGKANSISLLILKNKLSLVEKLNYNDGSIHDLVFDIEMLNDNLSGDIDLTNLEINKLKIGGPESGDYLTFKGDQLQLSFSKKKDSKVSIANVSLTHPDIDIHSFVNKNNANSESQKRKDLLVKKGIFNPSAFIENLVVIDGKIQEYRGEGDKELLFSFKKLDLEAKKIVFYDSTNTTLPLAVGELDFSMQNIVVHSFPQFNLDIDRFEMDSSKKKAILKNFSFVNKNSAKEFFKSLKYRKAWMALTFPKMELDIDLYDFFSAHPHIPYVNVEEAYFKNIIPLNLIVSADEKPLPNRMLAQATYPITIDSINIKNSKLDIQFMDVGNKHGLLQFNDINAKVSNLTTDKTTWSRNNEMDWIMDATMWKSGKMHAEVNYKLDSPTDEFTMIASLDSLIMIDSDTLTANLYDISVESGFLSHAAIDISGNNDEASGIVQFDYDDLKLNLKRKRKVVKNVEETKKVKKKDRLNESFVKNIIVNGLLSKKNMPDKSNYTPYGEAYFQREKNKPIFHLMWYTTSSGLLEVVQSNVVKDIKNINQMFKKKGKEE